MKIYSFPPIVKHDAKILILGTMPGKTSLEKNEYYAYKHNVFRKIMFDLFRTPFSDEYKVIKELLLSKRIALWDTLKLCKREGSLDSGIMDEVVNDFDTFLKRYRGINSILFNGKASFNYFKKNVELNEGMKYYPLPSTSPANARMTYEEKRKEWSIITILLES